VFLILVADGIRYNIVIHFLNLKGIYLFALQKDKCQEKVWKRVMGFGEAGKKLSSKVFSRFPKSNYQPL
jgi:hypothetical protein